MSRSGAREQARVQLDVGEVREPDQRGQIVGKAVIDALAAILAPDGRGLHPVRAVRRAALLVEELAVHAVGIALQRQRPAARWPSSTGATAA